MRIITSILAVLFVSLSCTTTVSAEDEADQGTFELDSSNFDKFVNGKRAALVKFYAPWCGHCQAMADDYRRLNKIVGKATDDILIVKVNADKERELGTRFGVRGYPTLLWFPKGGDVKAPEKYHGGRDFAAMLRFIKEHSKVEILQGAGDARKYSTDVTLRSLSDITSARRKAFVMFYAPWCGHCKAFKDNYEQIAKAFVNEKSCVIALLDGSAERDASEKFGIKGFPTFKMISSSDNVVDYNGPRDPNRMVDFINEQCGTHRRLDGSLAPEAGIIPDFERLGKDIILSKSAMKAEQYKPLVEQMRAKNPGFAGDFYAKLLTRILVDASYAFIKAEVSRMESVLSKSTTSLDDKQRDEFTIRKNILSRFLSIIEAAGDVFLKSDM